MCSILEAVLLSITPSFSMGLASKGDPTGLFFESVKKDIDKPLSAILTLNTIAHTVGAIGVGAQAGKVFGENYFSIGGFHLTYESLIAGVMTLAILILSEIIPKTIGANNWKKLAPFTASTLKVLLWVLKPFVWLSQLITNSLKNNKEESVLSRSDFKVMAQTAGESGEIKDSEYQIIHNLLGFEKRKAEEIMTPKTVMVMANENQSIADFYQDNKEKLEFSRIPLFKENQDNITGVLLKDHLLEEIIAGNTQKSLKEIAKPVSFVNEELSLPHLFEELIHKNKHLSIVTNQFGTVQGLVTMEDLIETLLGKEIVDETDTTSDMQKLAKEKWDKKAEKLDLNQGEEEL